MKVGTDILMVKPAPDCPIGAGQRGRVVDFDADNFWHLRWDDGRQTFWPDHGSQIADLRHDIVCDFCSGTPIAWRCHATSEPVAAGIGFAQRDRLVTVAMGSSTDWAACDRCKRLIEAGNGPRYSSTRRRACAAQASRAGRSARSW